jgi:membrane-associated phospholipid phosphatase
MGKKLATIATSSPGRLIAAKLLMIVVLALAVTQISLVAHVDRGMTEAVHALTAGWLTVVVGGLTQMGGSLTIIALTVVAVAALAAFRHWRGAAALALVVPLTQAVVAGAKALVSRPRPDAETAIAEPSGFSFPSAHSASAVALYVMLALIAASIWRGRSRTAAWLAAGAVVLTVGASRVYLGAHYPTDVLAGWLLGGVLVVATWEACSRLPGGSHPAVA